ncbi:MAG: hypothetical protein CVT92_04400 [Bacteroidetes bacterium HGW-Bacteroidetes-1]|nr:MAG: hypothetical protein CVT92_04400 [Bacteroidetes bacterium HGW-Bacteroidetes-1]
MHQNPNNWRGVFYHNKMDYRIIVPKQNPMLGYTLNFSSPLTYLGLIAIAVIIIAFSVLS